MSKLSSRRTAIFFNKYGVITEIISVTLISVSGYFRFAAGFDSSTPSSFLGVVVNEFLMVDLSLIVFIVSLIVSVGGGILWVVSKNAPPLVDVNVYPRQGVVSSETSIELTNNEPSDLQNIYIKILKWKDLSKNLGDFDYRKIFESDNIIEFDNKVLSGDIKKIPFSFVENFDGKLRIPIREFDPFLIEISDIDATECANKYEVLMEVHAQPTSEKFSMKVGIYEGILVHKRINGCDIVLKGKGKEVIRTKRYEEFVFWEEGSFKQVKDKKELRAVRKIQKGLAS